MSADSHTVDEDFRRVHFELREGNMAGIAFGDQSRPLDILFLHATGFNARTYRRMLAPLGERFHVVALDARGHGLTQLPERLFTYSSWNRHRDDMIALLDKYVKAPVTLAGHSMGATTSLLVAGKRPDLVNAVALIDPVLLPEERYRMLEMPFATMTMRKSPMVRGAANRRGTFASRDDARAALYGRGVFKRFPDDILDDYLGDGLIDDGVGGVKLSCSPQYEAATFSAQRIDPWTALGHFDGPLVCLRAEVGSTCPANVLGRFKELRPDARMAVLEGSTHMLPMERPDRVRAAVETAAIMAQNGKRFRDLE